MDAQTVSGSRGKKTEHKSYDEIMGMRIEVAKQLVAENPKITREKLVHLLVRRGMKKVLATEAAIRALNN